MSGFGAITAMVGAALASFGLVALWAGILGKARPPAPDDHSSPAGSLRWLVRTSPRQLRYGARAVPTGVVLLALGLLLMSRS